MSRTHPYRGLPDRQFWQREPALADPAAFDPVTKVPFRIAREDKVMTAGSCFAQHLARELDSAGFRHFVTETAHPIFNAALAAEYGYGQFSARYANVYTARQFLQLVQRATGGFDPVERAWPLDGGGVVDPFRPRIQPGGFVSVGELEADREQHFAAVRRALDEADVLVFTLGLTEAWEDRRDGAIYPLAPGVAGGAWDPATVAFRNFDEAETAADLQAALELIRARNPGLRVLLTVSPVPLNATYLDRHVFVSTTWSKAALRIAAEKVANALPQVAYFPSYEIITSPHARGCYYAEDAREVLPEGVAHVMRLFFRHFAAEGAAAEPAPKPLPAATDPHLARMRRAVQVACDEEALDNR